MNVAAAYLYLNALWVVNISVCITDKFLTLNAWAVRSVYISVFLWIVVIATLPFGCFPFSRRWDGFVGRAKPCPNIVREWDFVSAVPFLNL